MKDEPPRLEVATPPQFSTTSKEFVHLMFIYLRPKTLTRLLMTCTGHWSTFNDLSSVVDEGRQCAKGVTAGGATAGCPLRKATEEYWRRQFFVFVQGCFSWNLANLLHGDIVKDSFSNFERPSTLLVIRACVGGSHGESFEGKRGVINLAKDIQLLVGMSYSFRVEQLDWIDSCIMFQDSALTKTAENKCNDMVVQRRKSYTIPPHVAAQNQTAPTAAEGTPSSSTTTASSPSAFAQLSVYPKGSVGRCASWRDLFTEVRQRVMVVRDHRTHWDHESFDHGEKRWQRLKDAALHEAVIRHVVNEPGWQRDKYSKKPRSASKNRMFELIDVGMYERHDKYTGEVFVERQALIADDTAPSSKLLHELGYEKVNFSSILGSAPAFPILGDAVCEEADLLTYGRNLIAAKSISYCFAQNAERALCLSELEKTHAEVVADLTGAEVSLEHAVGDGRPVVGREELRALCRLPAAWRSSAVMHRALLDHSLLRGDASSDVPAAVYDAFFSSASEADLLAGPCCVVRGDSIIARALHSLVMGLDKGFIISHNDILQLAREWRMHTIEQIRLAVLRFKQFYPYRDGTVWQFALSTKSDTCNRELAAPGRRNLSFIGPQAVMSVDYIDFQAEGADTYSSDDDTYDD